MSNFPSFDAPSGGQSEYKVTGHEGTGVEEDEERARFESSFPDIGGEASAIEVGPSAMIGFERFVELNTTSICRPTPPDHTQSIPYGATPYPAQPYSAPTQASNYTSILPAPTFPSTQLAEQDSPAIAEWRERQAGEIKKRDEESKRKKEEVVLKAEKAIDGFYERYNEEKEKSIKKNKWVSAVCFRARDEALGRLIRGDTMTSCDREDEKAFLENLQESLSKGTTWERITDLVDLQNSRTSCCIPLVSVTLSWSIDVLIALAMCSDL